MKRSRITENEGKTLKEELSIDASEPNVLGLLMTHRDVEKIKGGRVGDKRRL